MGAFALTAAMTLPACDDAPPEPEPDPIAEEAVPVVTLRSDRVLASGSWLAKVGGLFGVEVPALVPAENAQAWAVGVVLLRLDALTPGDPPCLEVETDELTYIEVTWADRCQSAALTIDGRIRADAALVTEPCAAGTCAKNVTWTVDADELDITVLGNPIETRFRGLIEVDAPVNGDPLGWRTREDFQLDFGVGTYVARSQARWFVDDQDCVVLDLDAELDLIAPNPDLDPAIEEQIGTVVVTGESLRRCDAKCPSAGSVYLSYGAGDFLQWTYGERPDVAEIEVLGTRMRNFIARLPCSG